MQFPVIKLTNTLKVLLPCLLCCYGIYSLLPPLAYIKYWIASQIEIESKIKPIFVIKTFYYPNSKTFNGSDAVVTLFNGESDKYNRHNFVCQRLLQDGTPERSVGKVLDLDVSPSECKLGVMRLTCLFPPKGVQITDYRVGLALENGTEKLNKLTVSEPNKKPYKFVACMSRMVAVDDWAMVIFAMETFRYFGGDLAVAPVDCAIKEVMNLLRLYERDGILKIQPAFKPKRINEIFYNPILQTEYSDQLSNSHECLYDFKESAEFISFPDWDDVLIGSRHEKSYQNYYNIFAPLIKQQPNAAAFSVDRFDTKILTPIHESEEFSVAKTLKKAVYGHCAAPKMVIRPLLVASSWIHSSKVMENRVYFETKTTVASFAHFNYTLLSTHNTTKPSGNSFSTFLDPNVLDSNFRSMLKRHSFEFKNANYSFDRPFRELIANYYRGIAEDFLKNGVTYCPSINKCKYVVQNVNVVRAETTYKKPFLFEPFIWIERSFTNFVTDNKGCL